MLGSCRVIESRSFILPGKKGSKRVKLKSLVVVVLALFALAAPASAGAVTLIGSGSVAAQPVLEPLFAAYTKVTKGKVKFVYTANGGNAGVKDVQNGTSSSPARPARHSRAMPERPT